MKLLFVTPWYLDGTRPRGKGIREELSTTFEVRTLSLVASGVRSAPPVAGANERLVGISKIGGAIRATAAVVRGGSLEQAFMSSRKAAAAISREIAEFEPDVVYFNVLRTAQFMILADARTRVVDLDEFRSKFYKQQRRTSSSLLSRLLARVESRRMENAERQVVKVADLVLVSSPTDLRQGAGAPIHLVRSPHELDGASPDGPGHPRPEGLRILFVGRQSYRPNRQAVRWFAQNVFPALLSKYPECVLQIVGDSPPKETRSLASTNIEVTGRVPSVAPYYQGATVAVAPIRQATGVQMKLIEALAMSVPSVVTPIVASGAGVNGNIECLIADSAEEWIEAVGSLLEDSHLRERLGVAGQHWAQAMHSRGAVRGQLAEALGSVGLRMGRTVGG